MTAERYVDAAELADLMGISIRTVRRLTAAGMPSETWGMGHLRRYLPSQAMGWAQARINANPPGRRANATGTSQTRRQP